jgi:hypothetical protein
MRTKSEQERLRVKPSESDDGWEPMSKTDVLTKYADAKIAVTLRQSIKRGGELMAVYRMDYPSLEAALAEVGDDLLAGRVEKICADGCRLEDEDIAALMPVRNS